MFRSLADDDCDGIDISLYEEDATKEEDDSPVLDKIILQVGREVGMDEAVASVLAVKLNKSEKYIVDRYTPVGCFGLLLVFERYSYARKLHAHKVLHDWLYSV